MESSKTYTPEDLAPKGAACKRIEMSIKRSRVLSEMCVVVLDQTGNADVARVTPPWSTGACTKTKIKMVFGEAPWLWTSRWPWLFDQWYTGALDRAELAAIEDLPRSVGDKLRKKPTQE